MAREAFIGTYCRWVAGPFTGDGPRGGTRELLSLKEKSNFDCILWKNGCTVYGARPVQCGTFPFWESIVHSDESWKELMKDCPGIGQGRVYSRAEIENMLARSSSEPIITRTI
jgi:Fe-S-cluster containining protein